MPFFKSLVIAIIATLLLTYFLGASFLDLLGIETEQNIYVKGEILEPIKAISMSALMSVFLIIATLMIVLSVFGSIIFILLLGVGAVFMLMVGTLWPILLAAIIFWLLAGSSKSKAHS